jgi:hypothetical protein
MKKSKFVLLVTVLILSISMLACAFGGNNNNTEAIEEAPAVQEEPAAAVEEPVQEEAAPAAAETTIETDFPLLADAKNVMETNGTVIYQSGTSLQDAFDFYYAEFTAQGLTENEILTLNDETMFQLVFTGTEDGKSLVIQTIKLDDSTINVTLRYE